MKNFHPFSRFRQATTPGCIKSKLLQQRETGGILERNHFHPQWGSKLEMLYFCHSKREHPAYQMARERIAIPLSRGFPARVFGTLAALRFRITPMPSDQPIRFHQRYRRPELHRRFRGCDFAITASTDQNSVFDPQQSHAFAGVSNVEANGSGMPKSISDNP